MIGDRHHCDRLYAGFIERPERGEEIRSGFDEITPPAEIDRRPGEAWRVRAEGEKRFSAARFARIEAKRRYRRIMGGELTWRGHVAAGFTRRKLVPKERLDLLPRKGAQAKQGQTRQFPRRWCPPTRASQIRPFRRRCPPTRRPSHSGSAT